MDIITRFLLILLASVTAARAADQCKLVEIGSAPMEIVPSGILVPVALDGHKARMLLRLSTGLSEIASEAADAMKLRQPSLNPGALTLGKKSLSRYAATKEVQIGSLRITGAQLAVTPLSASEASKDSSGWETRVVGVIGMGMLGNTDIELDFQARKVSFYAQDHCPGRVVYWADRFAAAPMQIDGTGLLFVIMELEGKKVASSLATTVQTTSIDALTAKVVYGIAEGGNEVQKETFSNGYSINYIRAMALSTDGLQLMNTRVNLRPAGACKVRYTGKNSVAHYENCLNTVPLQIGLNVLSKLHLYIATKEKMLYFTTADAGQAIPTQ